VNKGRNSAKRSEKVKQIESRDNSG